jgi:ParB/RepB/Spo0J family partition protein
MELVSPPCDAERMRSQINEAKTLELAASIREIGQKTPIVVQLTNADAVGYIVVSGYRRYLACQELGLPTIDALIVSGDDVALIGLLENCHREDLSPIDEARWIKHLKDSGGYTDQKLAVILGRSRSMVSQILTITNLPAVIQKEAARKGQKIGRDQLIAVARVKEPGEQKKAWKAAKAGATRATLRQNLERSPSKTNLKAHQARLDRASKLAENLKKALLKVNLQDVDNDDITDLETLKAVLSKSVAQVEKLIAAATKADIEEAEFETVITPVLAGHPINLSAQCGSPIASM